MKMHILITGLIIGLMGGGCLDTIELDLPEQRADRLVIEGYVLRGDMYEILVNVSRSVQSEEVILNTVGTNDITVLIDDIPSLNLQNGQTFRAPAASFHTIYGGNMNSEFKLQVEMQNGDVYVSTPQRIEPAPALGSLHISLAESESVNTLGNIVTEQSVELFVDSEIINSRGDKTSLRWDVSSSFMYQEIPCGTDPFYQAKACYVDVGNRRNEINVLIGPEVVNDRVENFRLGGVEADYKFNREYYFTVVQRTLTAESARYWDQIVASNARSGTIFDIPPGTVTTNMQSKAEELEQVLGFFYGSEVDTLRYLALPPETGRQRHQCANESGPIKSPHCCDCDMTYGIETRKKPSYWR